MTADTRPPSTTLLWLNTRKRRTYGGEFSLFSYSCLSSPLSLSDWAVFADILGGNARPSLGILVWQAICGGVPYGIGSPVDSDNKTDADKIRGFLAGTVEPGTFPDTVGLPPDLVSGVRACWNHDPKQRPTAASVSRTLCDSLYRLRYAHDEVPQSDPDAADHDGPAKTRALSLVAQRLQEEEKKDLMKKSKKSKKSKKKDPKDKGDGDTAAADAGRLVSQVPAAVREDKITAQDVRVLIRDSEAQCAYLVGASVWWSLLDEEALLVTHGSRSAEFTTTTDDGKPSCLLPFDGKRG